MSPGIAVNNPENGFSKKMSSSKSSFSVDSFGVTCSSPKSSETVVDSSLSTSLASLVSSFKELAKFWSPLSALSN